AAQQDQLKAAQAGGDSKELASLMGDLKVAKANHDLLVRQHATLLKLVDQKAATPEELEKNQADLVRATAQVEELEKSKEHFDLTNQQDLSRLGLVVAHTQDEIKNLQEKIDSARVTAPVNGT